ncbi:MAG: phytanoyl-CoA dioxygenase family protein [Spirosomataceae bacterium]
MLAELKTKIKDWLKPIPKEFEADTLPWVDQPYADIDAFVKQYAKAKELPYDLAEKLRFWQENGFVILEQAIPQQFIDVYWGDVSELIENHKKYETEIRIDLPEFSKKPIQKVKDVTKEVLTGPYIKINDFHNQSLAGKKLMLHPSIVYFLEAVFGSKVVAMQSLTFLYGSQQATHQDFAYVVSEIPSHLAAAWIPIEDVQPDSGPLTYYVGSHKIKKFNFGNGIFFNEKSTRNPDDFAKYLEAECQRMGLEKRTLLIKKGDVLLWHAALAHGGEPIRTPGRTRKSYVCHYSSDLAFKHHRNRPAEEPIRYEYNGAEVFGNPSLVALEDSFKAGEVL